ncbi:MAG: hypothetical protein R2729_05680 [Bryobacteraceae bacterium]
MERLMDGRDDAFVETSAGREIARRYRRRRVGVFASVVRDLSRRIAGRRRAMAAVGNIDLGSIVRFEFLARWYLFQLAAFGGYALVFPNPKTVAGKSRWLTAGMELADSLNLWEDRDAAPA